MLDILPLVARDRGKPVLLCSLDENLYQYPGRVDLKCLFFQAANADHVLEASRGLRQGGEGFAKQLTSMRILE